MIKKRNVIMDLAKFVMSIYILIGHFVYYIANEYPKMALKSKIYSYLPMASIVAVFFVCSGYLAVRTYKGESVFSYVKQKAYRLFPLMILSIIEFCIAGLLFFIRTGHFFGGRSVMLDEILTDSLGISLWIGKKISINTPIWYISALMFCYFLYVLMKNTKYDQRVLFPVLSIAGILIANWGTGFGITCEYMGRGLCAFFFGCSLALLMDAIPRKMSAISVVIAVLYGSILITSYVTRTDLLGDAVVIGTLVYGLLLIVIGENLKCQNQRVIMITGKLGGLSYPIYLLHIPTFILWFAIFEERYNIVQTRYIVFVVLGVILHSVIALKITNKILLWLEKYK